MGTNTILSLVDVAGSVENLKRYRTAVENTLPASIGDKTRYWNMYAKIADNFAHDPKVTDKKSIIDCMFNAVKLCLNPDPVFGEIYFIPYKGVLTYQIGYKGMIKLSLNAGILDIRAGLVFEADEWTYYEDETGQHYKFTPNYAALNRGKELFVYSVFQKSPTMCSCHIMESAHVDGIKKMVLARTPSSPWANKLYEPELRKKTCMRQQWKTQPKTFEIAAVIEHEESVERGEILKQNHPEIEDILDNIINSDVPQQEERPLSIFDEPRMSEIKTL